MFYKFKKRYKVPAKKSKRLFTHTAMKTHPLNLRGMPMRGGIRI